MILGGDIERIKEELQPLFTDVKNTVNALPKSSIKRIQKGYFAGFTSTAETMNIAISSVNTAKSILLVNFVDKYHAGKVELNSNYISITKIQHIIDIRTSTNLGGGEYEYRFGKNLTNIASPFCWQVIEFN